MNIKLITKNNKEKVMQFFIEHWKSTEMIISTGVYNCSNLDGYIFEEQDVILGLLTYVIREDEIEVISLDSLKEGRGIGSKLMNEVELLAKQKGINK